MIRYLTTCRFCGKQYYYQASGEGCHNPENDSHFCKDCMNILLKSAKGKNRYRRFLEKPKEIVASRRLKATLEKIKSKCDEENEKTSYTGSASVRASRFFFDKFSNVDTYYTDSGEKFVIKWNDDHWKDRVYYQVMEYDSKKGEFTGNRIFTTDPRKCNTYIHDRAFTSADFPTRDSVTPVNWEETAKDISEMYFEWEIIPNTKK